MPLGQCLQPGHTLAPVAVQRSNRPPRLQAPDVHQPTQGPVLTSASTAQEEASGEGIPSMLCGAGLETTQLVDQAFQSGDLV